MLEKIFNKSKVWHKHGKHAKIDPRFFNKEKPVRLDVEWYDSVSELFKKKK
jgi:hypothetical protein